MARDWSFFVAAAFDIQHYSVSFPDSTTYISTVYKLHAHTYSSIGIMSDYGGDDGGYDEGGYEYVHGFCCAKQR